MGLMYLNPDEILQRQGKRYDKNTNSVMSIASPSPTTDVNNVAPSMNNEIKAPKISLAAPTPEALKFKDTEYVSPYDEGYKQNIMSSAAANAQSQLLSPEFQRQTQQLGGELAGAGLLSSSAFDISQGQNVKDVMSRSQLSALDLINQAMLQDKQNRATWEMGKSDRERIWKQDIQNEINSIKSIYPDITKAPADVQQRWGQLAGTTTGTGYVAPTSEALKPVVPPPALTAADLGTSIGDLSGSGGFDNAINVGVRDNRAKISSGVTQFINDNYSKYLNQADIDEIMGLINNAGADENADSLIRKINNRITTKVNKNYSEKI